MEGRCVRRPNLLICLLIAPWLSTPALAQGTPPRAPSLDSLLSQMTLEEKLGQLNLMTVNGAPTAEQLAQVRAGQIGGLFNLLGDSATHVAQQVAVEQSRLKIPLLIGQDVIHGYRTTFPTPLAEASSWDPELAQATAHAAAQEAAAGGVNWTYAPMVDIARDPRWGRIVEGAGEDPYLGSLFAAARVRGFQGPSLTAPGTVMATAKHFAAYGAAQAGREYNTVDVSQRTLREVYLPPFHAAVNAGVGSIMSAFNEIGGIPSSANPWLTDSVLRGEWGFNGLVVSDWTSIAELMSHGIARSRGEAGRLALEAGVDMDMVSEIYLKDLPDLVQRHEIPQAVVDTAVRRVLAAKVRLGLFADPYHGAMPAAEQAAMLTPEHRALARRDGQEAIVLLKNDHDLLPVSPGIHNLAVIGPLAASTSEPLGPWAAYGRAQDVVSVLQGIRERAPHGMTVAYAQGCRISDTSTAGFAEAVATAKGAQLALLVLGEAAEMSGEASSRAFLDLPGVQQRLLEAVAATGTPVALVIMSGRPLILEWAAEHVPAIVESWFLGVETGHALADVLFGDVSPSGKLPVTVPRALGQVPLYYDHKHTGRPPDADNKFTSKYLDVLWTPRYPFGYGLSYTTFDYSDMSLDQAAIGMNDTLHVAVTVANSGKRAGTEIVELYVHDEVASITRPVKQLEGFQRVSLKPGESRRVTFALPASALGLWNAAMQYVVEPGAFRVFVGPSSATGLEATFEVR
jgi:beta-glucosidase